MSHYIVELSSNCKYIYFNFMQQQKLMLCFLASKNQRVSIDLVVHRLNYLSPSLSPATPSCVLLVCCIYNSMDIV